MGLTRRLIGVIERGERVSEEELPSLVEAARANKVLLGFLRRAGVEGRVRSVEEERYRVFIEAVKEVVEELRGLRYALYKFRKPVEHVSVDIDILVHTGDVGRAAARLAKRGFRIDVAEPYTVTLRRGGVIVDLYTHPAFAWVVYMNGEELLRCCIEEFDLDGVSAQGVSREAEAVVAAAHAVYKEHIYLLIDYFTTKRWLGRRALRLAEDLGVGYAARLALGINRLVEAEEVETPYRIPLAWVAKGYAEKILGDPAFRATSLNILRYLAQRRAGKILLWKLTRETY